MMLMIIRLLICLIIVAIGALGTERPARAQPSGGTTSPAERARNKAQADDLKKRGDGEMESLRYADALTHYNEAYRLTRDPALLYNQARSLEALERFVEAFDALEAFTREAPPEMRARVPKLKELLSELGLRTSNLIVHCETPNARILVRDKVVATTPTPDPIRLNAGSAELEVAADGYVPFKKKIELPKGGSLTVDVVLTPRAVGKGQIVIASIPEGADVKIDGKRLGRAPAETELAVGNHAIMLSLDGYQDSRTSAVITEGQKKRVDITLEKTPSVLSRWWFWTGIGIVAVTATVVVLTYAFTTEREPGQGDIPPGRVAGPLRF